MEFADRWSSWQRVVLATGEEYVFDLGDRRAIHPHKKWQETTVKGELRMTSLAPGAQSATAAAASATAAASALIQQTGMKRPLEVQQAR